MRTDDLKILAQRAIKGVYSSSESDDEKRRALLAIKAEVEYYLGLIPEKTFADYIRESIQSGNGK